MKKHEIFKSNPNLKEVYMTSDGQSFYNDNDAKMHAKTLEGKKVELVKNPDHLEVVLDEDTDTVTSEVGTIAPKVFDLRKLKKEDLLIFAGENHLTLEEGLTNPKMVESIELQLLEKLKVEKTSEGITPEDTQNQE